MIVHPNHRVVLREARPSWVTSVNLTNQQVKNEPNSETWRSHGQVGPWKLPDWESHQPTNGRVCRDRATNKGAPSPCCRHGPGFQNGRVLPEPVPDAFGGP